MGDTVGRDKKKTSRQRVEPKGRLPGQRRERTFASKSGAKMGRVDLVRTAKAQTTQNLALLGDASDRAGAFVRLEIRL